MQPMQPRIPLVLASIGALAGAGLWLALGQETPGAQPGAALAPRAEIAPPPATFDSSASRQEAEPAPARVPEAKAVEADDPRARGGADPGARELTFVAKPKPGVHRGPLAREFFESGAPLWEAQQIQDADGTWILDGDWIAWHENGEVQERGAYREHQEHGLWEWWHDNGEQIARGRFDHGQRIGAWTFWYEDGNKRMDGYYQDGVGEGHWVLYHESGLKAAEGGFEHGELSGPWTIWSADGAIDHARSGLYEGGERVAD